MREHHQLLALVQRGEVFAQPFKLFRADAGRGVGDVVDSDEVHAFVGERISGIAEKFSIGRATVERSIVFAGDKAHGFDVEFGNNFLEFAQTLAPQCTVIRGVGQVAGEHDKVRRRRKCIDGGYRLLQRACRIRVGWPAKAPVRVRQLHEIEIILRSTARHAGSTPCQTGGEHHTAADTCQTQELTPINLLCHFVISWIKRAG